MRIGAAGGKSSVEMPIVTNDFVLSLTQLIAVIGAAKDEAPKRAAIPIAMMNVVILSVVGFGFISRDLRLKLNSFPETLAAERIRGPRDRSSLG
jgi:hypothetical protein